MYFKKLFKGFCTLLNEYIYCYNNKRCFRDVLPSVEPGYLLKTLPKDAPEQPEDWKDVLNDFQRAVLPGVLNITLFINK